MSLWGKGNQVWRSCDLDGRAKVKAGDAVNIHGRYWISKERWNQLKPWQHERLKIIAVGLHAHSAVVVGRSAGVLWQLDVLGNADLVDMARRKAQSAERKSGNGVRYRSTKFLPGDVKSRKGIDFTNLNRTLVDICRWEGFVAGLVAMESAMQEGRSLGGLRDQGRAMKGMHGMKTFWRVMEFAKGKSESAAESYAYATMIEAGIDTKLLQQNVEMTVGGEIFRPDFIYDGWLLIEIDGEIKYSGAYGDVGDVVLRERRRENTLRNQGYDTIRVTWGDISNGKFIQTLNAKIAERERRLKR